MRQLLGESGGVQDVFIFQYPTKIYQKYFLSMALADKGSFQIHKKRLPIAYIELIAALVGFSVFSQKSPHTIISLFSDNTDVVA